AEEIRRILSRLVAMSFSSDLQAAAAQVGKDDFDALLVDRAQTLVGNPQLDPAVLARHSEAAFMEVRQPAAPRLVVRVGNIVAGKDALPGDLTDSGHAILSRIRLPTLGQGGGGPAAAMRHAMPGTLVGCHGRGSRTLIPRAGGLVTPANRRSEPVFITQPPVQGKPRRPVPMPRGQAFISRHGYSTTVRKPLESPMKLSLPGIALLVAAALASPARADPRGDVQAAFRNVLATGWFRVDAWGRVFGPDLPSVSGEIAAVLPDRIRVRSSGLEFIALPDAAWTNAFGTWVPTGRA